MKAMVLNGPSSLSGEEVTRPTARDGEVVIRVSNTGICGTDLKIFQGGIPVDYPLIMGHETIGEVEETNADGAAGGRVIVDPAYFCGNCYHCRNLCL